MLPLQCLTAVGCLIWRFPRLRLCLEVTEQAGESLLVGVVIFPSGEVTDMPHAANIGCPCLRSLHHCLIEPHREEHKSVLPMLLLKCRFDFPLHPDTSHRML